MKNVIYQIESKMRGKKYIGSAEKFNIRFNQHKHHLLKRTHHNRHLQNHVNKHGFDDLVFTIIENDCSNLPKKELFYILKINPEFNATLSTVRPPKKKRTPEQIKRSIDGRMAKSGYPKGRKVSKETRQKIGDAHRGKSISKEQKKQISESHKGKVISEETKKQISKSMKGRIFSDEHKAKLSKSAKGNKNGSKK